VLPLRQDVDHGFSLVEVLIAVVILGVAFTGLLAGMATASLSSGVHRGQADAHMLLVSAAESMKDEGRNPFACSVGTYDPTVGVTAPAGWTLSDLTIDPSSLQSGYWNGTSFAVAACGTGTDLQRLTLVAASPDGRVRERLTIIKRRP
jgi:prepilin-type N-terminal cleavage/methylation domain-containing protein